MLLSSGIARKDFPANPMIGVLAGGVSTTLAAWRMYRGDLLGLPPGESKLVRAIREQRSELARAEQMLRRSEAVLAEYKGPANSVDFSSRMGHCRQWADNVRSARVRLAMLLAQVDPQTAETRRERLHLAELAGEGQTITVNV